VRADLTNAMGKPLGTETYRITITGGVILDRQRFVVVAGVAAVGEEAKPQLAGLIEDGVAFFKFDDRTHGLGADHQNVAVGSRRHLEYAGAHGAAAVAVSARLESERLLREANGDR